MKNNVFIDRFCNSKRGRRPSVFVFFEMIQNRCSICVSYWRGFDIAEHISYYILSKEEKIILDSK